MKKQFLILAGSLLTLAACNNGASSGPSEAQIDSMVNARVQVKEMELMAKNDSIINAMATMKADSMMMAAKAGAPTASSTTRPRTTRTVIPPAPVKTTQDQKFDNRENGGKQQQQTPEQKKAQDDKFNKRGG